MVTYSEISHCTVCHKPFVPSRRADHKMYRTCPECRQGAIERGRNMAAKNRERYGHDHYVEIGKMGGARISELIKRGKEAIAEADIKGGNDGDVLAKDNP